MGQNIQTLVNRNNIEAYTPKYAVDMITPYISKDKVIWAPFDLESSNFVRYLREKGYKVIHSHIFTGQDFLEYEPKEHYDVIVSNPPFKNKRAWVERALSLGKPFALLLPASWINDISWNTAYDEAESKGKQLQLLIPDRRISFDGTTKTASFKSCFWCLDLLPKQIVTINIKTIAEEIPMYKEVEELLKDKEVK